MKKKNLTHISKASLCNTSFSDEHWYRPTLIIVINLQGIPRIACVHKLAHEFKNVSNPLILYIFVMLARHAAFTAKD